MEVLTTTPFGRRLDAAGLLRHVEAVRAEQQTAPVNKWSVMRDLTAAKARFGLNAGALTVLNALLSFHKGDELGQGALVVFPSNAILAGRAHGMPESTLRRHLGTLVKAGLILRHDSPNGKRYAVRGQGGDITRAFGFDLRPLVTRADEFTAVAREVALQAEEVKRAREAAMLLKRDCWALMEEAKGQGVSGPWDTLEALLQDTAKRMRRILDMTALGTLTDALRTALDRLERLLIKPMQTDQMSACDGQNERHIQNSNKDKLESEQSLETEHVASSGSNTQGVPVELVLQACPDVAPYAWEPIRHRHQLVECAHLLHRMMGISPDVWHGAMKTMGEDTAAVTLACILQRMDRIKNPGAYLRTLTRKSQDGQFSVWPMVRALLGQGAQAS